jgi:hypothetical protein
MTVSQLMVPAVAAFQEHESTARVPELAGKTETLKKYMEMIKFQKVTMS